MVNILKLKIFLLSNKILRVLILSDASSIWKKVTGTPSSSSFSLSRSYNLCQLMSEVGHLTHPLVANRLGDYIQGMRPQIDDLCFQEHKLQGVNLETNLFRVWPRASTWARDASPCYSATNPMGGATKGRLLLLVHPNWCSQVIDFGRCANNGAIWI